MAESDTFSGPDESPPGDQRNSAQNHAAMERRSEHDHLHGTVRLEGRLTEMLAAHAVGNGRMLVGVSGGADSVALLRLLLSINSPRSLELVVGHYDHALRSESAEDAAWVQDLCGELSVPCIVERNSQPHQDGSEDRARQRRYDFLERVAAEQGCRWVAVAHTADDQAETVLHHILRGSGLRGLAGMPVTRPLSATNLIRPLLEFRRGELLSYLAAIDQSFREDPSNWSREFTRNRLRHDLLPWLRREFNSQVDAALIRLAAQSREAHRTLEQLAAELLQSALLDQHMDRVRLCRSLLKDRPQGLVQELFQLLWRVQSWPRLEFNHRHVEALTHMAMQGVPAGLSLPGVIQATIRGEVLELHRRKLPTDSQGGI